MRVSKEYREALMADAVRVRASIAKSRAEGRDGYDYRDDPDISDHDKELQAVMDYDLEHPDDAMARLREEHARLESFHGSPYDGGFWSVKDRIERLERDMSDEAVAGRQAEYREYLALRAEAVSKGFVRGGECGNVRRGHEG